MDFWRSEYEEGNSTSSALAGLQELVDSPNLSRDSIDYSSDDPNSVTSEPAESLKFKLTPKTTLLAKKRLQAYSSVNKFKPGNVKEEKDETSITEKPHKTTFKKLRKTIYPDDAAKAVIRDIESLKRAGFGAPLNSSVLSTLVPTDIIHMEPFVPISLGKLNIDKSPTISLCSDMEEENLFKKREIKCRNIRKSEITSRRSSSPKKSTKSNKTENHSKTEKREYPLNWAEYKELNLDFHKDGLLKQKLFKKPRSKHFAFKRYFNFELPSAPIEIYKCQPISGDALWIPFPFIRSTASKPQILYSTNRQNTSPGYLTRKQLFSIISNERKAIIEQLWKAPSRCQPSNKKNISRKWYPRNWKKFDNSEAKLLEKSVGLSFLQSYSDEEDDVLEDSNDEFDVEKEVDLWENRISISPSATPKELPKNFIQDIQEDSVTPKNAGTGNWDEPIEYVFSSNEKTPPIEDEEEGEVSLEETPKEIYEDEYQKTKKELESLEEALKESSTNFLDSTDKTSVEKDQKMTKQKKKNKDSRQEKESKSKNKNNKLKRKFRKKSKDESGDDVESSDFEKESIKKKKQKNRIKHLKDKLEKKAKRRKAKKKKSKKKKEMDSSESENHEIDSDVDENVPKKINKIKRKSSNKSSKESASEESSGKVHDRKNSVDITHEGYEDDVKFFTARFDKEDDLRGKIKYKKEDSDISRCIQKKNKTNIDLEELTISSKSDNDKPFKHKSKIENSEYDEFLSLENIQKKNEHKEGYSASQERNRKHSSERNKIKDDAIKSTELKEDGKKDEIKIDLLKKNEEYLREQDKLRIKQKKISSDNISSSLIKTPEPSVRSDDESLFMSKSQRLEKPKTKDTESKKDYVTSEFKGQERDKKIEKLKSPKKTLKDIDTILSSDGDLNIGDKMVNKRNEMKTSKVKQDEHTESKIIFVEKDTIKTEKDNTKSKKDDFERGQIIKPLNNVELDKNKITNIIDDGELTDSCAFERQDGDTNILHKQPDWEQLKNKRKRHISDIAPEKVEESKRYLKDSDDKKNAERFSLELPIVHIKKEKEDIEICDPTMNREQSTSKQINTSWETDEEVLDVERRCCSSNEENPLNLEIPLNIKHFPRREIKVESDMFDKGDELRQLQRHSRDLSAERKKLEIEKIKVTEMERELLQAQEKDSQHTTQIKSYLKTKRDEKEQGETTVEFDVQTPPKKRRWDIKSSDSTISTPKVKTEKSIEIIDVDADTFHNAVTLENEYEEFLKAVTSTKKGNHYSNKPIVIDSSLDSSIITTNEVQKPNQKFEINSGLVSEEIPTKNSSPFKQLITNIDELMPKPIETTPVMDISTLQIPLPPVKQEEIRPVPVPLPKLEAVFDLNKPLINLSLSANVTQNITLSLATSVTSISAPITSSIDISKTSVEISTPVSKDTVVSMNNIPLPVSKSFGTDSSSSPAANLPNLKLNPMQVSSKSETSPETQLSKEETNLPRDSACESDLSSGNTYLIDKAIEKTPMKQKIVFATLTLPSKKQLLTNSNLNLDDSDNDDQSIIEELKRKKLEALIEDNKKEVLGEEINKPVISEEKRIDASKGKSPVNNTQFSKDVSSKKTSPHKSSSWRESSPRRKRESPLKRRDFSPKRRDLSPKRRSPKFRSPHRSIRGRSPTRKRSPHRRRSPGRRSTSPRKRRSISPRKRRSPSPRRKRSMSPKNRQSPRRNRSISPKNKNRSVSPRLKTSRHSTSSQRNRSPRGNERKKSPVHAEISSPFCGPKRSVADSTISDDQLPQSTSNEDYSDTIFSNFQNKNRELEYDSPKRIPLDVRISQVLGYDIPYEEPQKPTSSTILNYNDHQQLYQYTEQYNNIQSQVTTPTMRNSSNSQGKRVPQSCYRQVGNMLQIVPNDDLIDIPIPEPPYQIQPAHLPQLTHQYSMEQKSSTNMDIKSQILQVGNMLQIVPTEMVPTEMIPVPPIQTEVKVEKTEDILIENPFVSPKPEKPSAEAAMLQKIAERRAERENRRHERERRRKEKESRNKEKEKAKQAKIKIKTENMIKKALEMEQEEDAEADTSGENVIQWPPLSIVVAHTVLKEAGKSILLTTGSRKVGVIPEEKRMKIVQFADGVKPGEGTSPSAGEELSSPPPPKKKLPKEKRFKKMKFGKKSAKKKVKVKIIKKPPSPLGESDSDDNLPPPSPPPGSPPSHIFPPRIKVNPVNNVPAAYLATIIQTAQQQQQQQQLQQQQQQLQQQQLHQQKLQQQQLQQQQYQSNIYCPPINLLMAPPPPPQGHPPAMPSHHQSPHGTAVPPAASPHGSQSHYHPSLAPPPPPPPPVSPHNHYPSSSGHSGHHRHY